MTDNNEVRNKLKGFADGSTVDASFAFLSTLGYDTSRRVNIPIDKDKLGNAEINNTSLFMQLTDAEMSGAESLFGTGKFEKQNIESYLFIAVDLAKPEYNRSTLAKITRDINKLFAIPVFVVFRYGMYITLSIIYRRIHKRDVQKDVLEKVTLIKDINVHKPHRGHIDILCDFALPKLRTQYPVTNFVELDNAWQKVLDTKELNKKFYKEVSYWFHWAKTKAKFPGGSDEVNLLRLLTRIIFIWFIKEKKLVHDSLFDEKIITTHLKSKDHYYNAILQNLFFGTLNCVIEDRKFRDERTFQGKNPSYGVKTQYRYANFFKCGEKEAQELFSSIPFLNGGLFDCLDTSTNESGKVEYVDGYSDNPKQRAVLPDELFFGETKQVDLNEDFGTKNKRYEVRGLFRTLARYKFTVAENTPLEEDVALDPELLGSVFENLLASYNPETRETARKQTGSFYTPREIVDYMVEQSLAHYPENDWQSLKILDPACGSGAFPMGVLNAMVNRFASDKSHAERYKLKKHIIENCLFGVDIQPIAVQITKLRFFISLVCEQEKDETKENLGITALPNLETRFVAANTLLGIAMPRGLSYTKNVKKLEAELKEIRHKYFSASTRKKKLELQKADEEKRKELAAELMESGWTESVAEKIADWNPYDQNTYADWFNPEWMFGVNEGFDIVIGNPPYVQLQKNKGELANLYENSGYETFARSGDVYTLFYESGWRLLKDAGHLCFITSNKWMRAGYGEKMRKFFAEKTNPRLLIDFAGEKVFESATVDTNILLLSKTQNHRQTRASIINKERFIDLNVFVEQYSSICDFSGDRWVILSPIERKIKAKIEAVGTPLKDWDIQINYGIKTGYNEAFILDGAKRSELITADPKSAEIIKPLLRGKDITRYGYEFADLYLITTFPSRKIDIEKYSAVKQHLLSFGIERLEQTGKEQVVNGTKIKSRKKTGNKWFEIQDQIGYWQDFGKPKIVWTPVNSEYRFTFLESEFVFNNSIFMLTSNNKDHLNMILSVMNSKLFVFYLSLITSEEYQYGSKELFQTFLIPEPNKVPEQTKPIITLVDRILSAKKENSQADTSALEHEIDALVFHLYGLTEKEIMSVLLSQNVSETDRQRIQAFYKDYEKKDKK